MCDKNNRNTLKSPLYTFDYSRVWESWVGIYSGPLTIYGGYTTDFEFKDKGGIESCARHLFLKLGFTPNKPCKATLQLY